jgi:hypothetical protein
VARVQTRTTSRRCDILNKTYDDDLLASGHLDNPNNSYNATNIAQEEPFQRRDGPHIDISWDTSACHTIYIAESRLDGAGSGAFAINTIDDGAIIGEYTGTILTHAEANKESNTSDYIWSDEISGYAVDAGPITSCAARYINDSLSEHGNNAKFVLQGGKLNLVATRTILPNEETCAGYGHEYWAQSRWPTTILRRAQQYHRNVPLLWSPLLAAKAIEDLHKRNPEVMVTGTDAKVHQLFDPSLDKDKGLKYKWIKKWDHTDFKLGAWNIGGNPLSNGGEKLNAIVDFARSSNMSCLYLTDVRLTKTAMKRLEVNIKEHLPQCAVVKFPTTVPAYVAPSPDDPESTDPPTKGKRRAPATMGGMVAIVHRDWWPSITNTERDCSGLGLIGRIEFKTSSIPITAIGVYLPCKTLGPYTVHTRLEAFLETSPERFKPRQYTEAITGRWSHAAIVKGHLALVAGDLNGVTEKCKSHRDVRPWIRGMNMAAPLTTILLPEQPDYGTFFRGDNPISRIDHILHSPLPEGWKISEVGVDNHISLCTVFDHRPIWAGVSLPERHERLQPIRFRTKPPRTEIDLDNKKNVDKYARRVERLCNKEVYPHIDPDNPHKAACLVNVMHHISIDVVAKITKVKKGRRLHRKCKARRSRFKNGFSPQMRIIQDALHLQLFVRRCLQNSSASKYNWSPTT